MEPSIMTTNHQLHKKLRDLQRFHTSEINRLKEWGKHYMENKARTQLNKRIAFHKACVVTIDNTIKALQQHNIIK